MANEFKVKKGLIVDGSNTVLDVQGTQGQLFSVTDSLTGDLFSVSDISGVPILNVNSSGLVNIDGDLNLSDGNEIKLGASQDLQIYHDGSNSYIKETGTGNLLITSNGASVQINKGTTENMAEFIVDGAVKLYYDSARKFETTNTGVTVTGNSTVTGISYVNTYLVTPIIYSGGGNVNFGNDIQLGSNILRFDQSGTRSWNVKAADGKLKFFSGDGVGNYDFDHHIVTTGGLQISGSIDPGATDYGYYKSGGNNIILKGDASGRSGIFFESEKDGTNINDPSDYGFIQFHSYGYGNTTGEANNLVIGVANDSTDHVILQSPYNGGVKVGYVDASSGTGLTTQTVFHDAYHPNADKWTTARTITLGGDLSGSVSIDGSADVTLTAAVSNDSHNHDGRYYTETESNAKFLTKDGSAKEWVFEVSDEGNFTGNKWYRVATVNKGNGGLHIRGLFSNHVEGFAAQKVDIGMVGREGGANDTLEVTGQVDVLHRSATGTDNCGIRIVEADITTSAHYHYFDVWVKTTRYQMLRLHLTKSGATTFYTSPIVVTTEPAPVSGGTTGVEIDTSIYLEGNYTISNSTPILTAKTTGTSVVGSLTAAADVIAYSDERLKENVKTLDGSKVLQMRGVSFDRKDTGISSSGVIAQEIQKVAPELVSDNDGTLGVAYGNLTGYLIEAIKDLKQEVEQLKKQIKNGNNL
jgi:hypothetical protein